LPRRVGDLPADAFVTAYSYVGQNLLLSNIALQ
jgi:hypothetical protein